MTAVRSDVDKASQQHVEIVASQDAEAAQVNTMGTVKLTDGETVYVPTPTADPQDPLNMRLWQKSVVLVVISTFSTLGLALVSGFGGLLTFYIPKYEAAGKDYDDITHLMTYPTLFMGIGNIIGMPLAIGVGRRIVLLCSSLVLLLGAALCAAAESYEWHLGCRMLIGLAAGQSESIVPMISQEIFFLHERSRAIMGQQAIQISLTAVWVLFASPIAGAITPQWWYGLGAILNGAQFLAAFFLLPETKYTRSLSSYQEASSSPASTTDDVEPAQEKNEVLVCTRRPPLDFVNYAARTWKSDMRLWVGQCDWAAAWGVIQNTAKFLVFPNVIWALILNGVTLGINIAISTTYSKVVTSAPYNWPDSSASYVNCGQIVTALVAIPSLGSGSDWLIQRMSKRNNGFHEPEVRLIPLCFPIVVGVFTSVLYGQGAARPDQYHWFLYAWTIGAYYFAFLGTNIVGITYLLDSYPGNAGPLLLIVCAFRGFISFGTSYATSPFIENNGYDGSFAIYGALTGALGFLAVPVYFFGKRIRRLTGRFARD